MTHVYVLCSFLRHGKEKLQKSNSGMLNFQFEEGFIRKNEEKLICSQRQNGLVFPQIPIYGDGGYISNHPCVVIQLHL